MGLRLPLYGLLGWMTGWFLAGLAHAQDGIVPVAATEHASTDAKPLHSLSARIALEQIPAEVRDRIRGVLERPTLRTQAFAEAFNCQPAFYLWLLDHPDAAVRLWRGLGVPCTPIQHRGEGRFGWQDEHGSDVAWTTVLRIPGQHVWFAEGRVKAAGLLPSASIRAVVCLNYREGKDEDGRAIVSHQVALHLQTDSRALALAARLLGNSAPRLAEQYAEQIQTFYAALAWYFGENPAKMTAILKGPEPTTKKPHQSAASTESPGH